MGEDLKMRRALILNDVNEAMLDNPIPKEIVVDYNNSHDICFIDDKGEYVSPTKNNRKLIYNKIREHMVMHDQHATATEEYSGFMSYEDKKNLNQLEKMSNYIKNNPYMSTNMLESTSYDGIVNKITYNIDNKKGILTINPIKLIYKGNIIDTNTIEIQIPERNKEENSYSEDLIYLAIKKQFTNGVTEYIVTPKYLTAISRSNIIKDSEMIQLFIIKRNNSHMFSPSNPYGTLSNNIIDNHEIVPIWSQVLVTPYNIPQYLKYVGESILNNHKFNLEYDVKNLHFGTMSKPVNSDTLIYVNINDTMCYDVVSGTNFDKSSKYIIGPVGLSLYESAVKGINIQLKERLNTTFTIDFIIKSRELYDDLITLKDSEYKEILKISTDGKYLRVGDTQITNLDSDNYTPITLVFNYNLNTVTIYKMGVVIKEISIPKIQTELVSFFELSSLSTIISDIRLVNTESATTHLTKDLSVGKGVLLPPIYKNHRKLSNNTSYQYNSVKIHYSDLGLFKDSKGFCWHKGDKILIQKNVNETLVGVFPKQTALCTVVGVSSEDDIIVNDISKLNKGDYVKIIKYNTNLLETYKILEIDETNKVLKLLDIKNINNPMKYVFDKRVIGSGVFPNDSKPIIMVNDSTNIIDSVQYPDDEGNIIIELENDSTDEYIFVNYMLITDYGNLIPKIYNIYNVMVNNVEYEEVKSSKKISILEKDIKCELLSDDKYKPFILDGVNVIKPENGNKLMLRLIIDFDDLATGVEHSENSIINNILNDFTLNLKLACNDKLKINTSEQSIIINPEYENILKPFSFNFTNSGYIVNDKGEVIIDFTIEQNDSAYLAFQLIDIELYLKTCSDKEKLYCKPGSNRPEDALIISMYPKPYIKTIFNKNETSNILITANVKVNEEDIELSKECSIIPYEVKLSNGYTANLVVFPGGNLYIQMISDSEESKLYRMPNKMRSKVGDLYASII